MCWAISICWGENESGSVKAGVGVAWKVREEVGGYNPGGRNLFHIRKGQIEPS